MLSFRNRNLLILMIALMALAVVAVACGGDDPTAAPAAAPTTAPAAAPTTAPAAAAHHGANGGPLRASAHSHQGNGGVPGNADTFRTAAPTPVPTEAPAMMAEAKVETLVISVDPSAGEDQPPMGWHR